LKRPFEHFTAWRLTVPPRALPRRRVASAPDQGAGMEADRVELSPYSKRLSSLYRNYFGEWRARFGLPATTAAPTSTQAREQRWEGEGGKS
jgi:hypothetical protein